MTAGDKGPTMEATTSTWDYTCRCRKEARFRIIRDPKSPRDRGLETDQIEQAIHSHGWVSKRLMDNDGRPHVFAYCSVACHNDEVREQERRNRSGRWWIKTRQLPGKPPVCCCEFVADSHGFISLERTPECPWHVWWDKYKALCTKRELELFEQWKDVAVGTIVVHRERGRAGHISAPAKLVNHSFGGWPNVLVPVKGWMPHPHASALMLPPGDGWLWLPPVRGETDSDRK